MARGSMPVLVVLLLTSCGSSAAGGPREGPLDDELDVRRKACDFERGALPEDTIGADFPVGSDIPIDHFIFLMQENRSFDSYFGTMPGVDGIQHGASNPDENGTPVQSFHATEYCIGDPAHGWGAMHEQFNGGLMDGFVVTSDPDGGRAMGYLDARDLPFYWDLYSTFAMSDRHFASVMTSTWTNRWYFYAATSFGRTSNDLLPPEQYGEAPYNLMQRLDDVDIDWRVYQSDGAASIALFPGYMLANIFRVLPIERFFGDVAAGDLPPVTWLDSAYFAGIDQQDEHPPGNPQVGQAFVAQVVNAVMQSPLWARTALIITYDEHGGLYDHVPPPESCSPDDHPAADSDGVPWTNGGYDHYGMRVPLVIVSPFAKAGYVSHRVTDHGSVVRLVETRFGLAALTRRDANAWPLLDMFDFENPPFMIPPALESAVVDPVQLDLCRPFLE